MPCRQVVADLDCSDRKFRKSRTKILKKGYSIGESKETIIELLLERPQLSASKRARTRVSRDLCRWDLLFSLHGHPPHLMSQRVGVREVSPLGQTHRDDALLIVTSQTTKNDVNASARVRRMRPS